MNEGVAVESPRVRPGWVWAIFLYYLLTSAGGVLLYALTRLHLLPIQAEQQAMLRSPSPSGALSGFLVMALSVFAATMLWLLRQEAVNLFIAVFILTVCNTVFSVVSDGPLARLMEQGTRMRVAVFFDLVWLWGMLLAICIYAWKLRKRGILA